MVGPRFPPKGARFVPAGKRFKRSRLEPRPRVQRDYEGELAAALQELGCQVIDYPAWKKCKDLHHDPYVIVRQYRPYPADPVTGKKVGYQLDFASPATLCNLEFDGFRGANGAHVGGHTNRSGFHRDRWRDSTLTLLGWRILRFGPDHVRTEEQVAAVAKMFVGLIEIVVKFCGGAV